jgi:starvation-inducible DNA-binding protein
MSTIEQLKETFSDNFVNSYRSHSLHFNITGENFYSSHKLLEKIYEDSEDIQDDLGELIRALDEFAPETISEVLSLADLPDTFASSTDSSSLLTLALEGQEHMIGSYQKLQEVSELEGHEDIENFAQDRIRVHKKFAWMLKASLG